MNQARVGTALLDNLFDPCLFAGGTFTHELDFDASFGGETSPKVAVAKVRKKNWRDSSASPPARRVNPSISYYLPAIFGYLQIDAHRLLDEQVTEVKRMLYSFIRKLS